MGRIRRQLPEFRWSVQPLDRRLDAYFNWRKRPVGSLKAHRLFGQARR